MSTENSRPQPTGIVSQKSNGLYFVLLNGETLLCGLSARLAKSGSVLAAGDQVTLDLAGSRPQIVGVQPRRNHLARSSGARPGGRATEQVFAANLDLIVPVISAASPAPRWALLDRYLVLAEARGIPALVCISKADLLCAGAPASRDVFAWVEEYRRIGYPVQMISSIHNEGIPALAAELRGRTSVLLGHSGVGKTSLLNALLPGLERRTGAVNAVTGKGRHTTTNPVLFPLPGGGAVLDTPGMREFGLWDVDAHDLDGCFPEMRPYLGRCRFRLDCQHDEEPGCAVRKAVTAGKIHPLRYQSYLKLKLNR